MTVKQTRLTIQVVNVDMGYPVHLDLELFDTFCVVLVENGSKLGSCYHAGRGFHTAKCINSVHLVLLSDFQNYRMRRFFHGTHSRLTQGVVFLTSFSLLPHNSPPVVWVSATWFFTQNPLQSNLTLCGGSNVLVRMWFWCLPCVCVFSIWSFCFFFRGSHVVVVLQVAM